MDEDFEAWKEERLTKDEPSSSSQVKSSSSSVQKSSASDEKSSSSVTVFSSSARSSSSAAASSSSMVVSSSSVPVSSSSVAAVNSNSFRDSRDGQAYRIVKIGTQTWMAENLNYETEGSYCYNNDATKCTKYGRLYTWIAATTACPSGWHLPSTTEWETLFTAVGGRSIAGTKLKSTSSWDTDIDGSKICVSNCDVNGNGTDAYGFSALPAGWKSGDFAFEGVDAYFWSVSSAPYGNYYYMQLHFYNEQAFLDYKGYIDALSVRCLKD
ncbi:fibrobacter succinogenes major paralogous domain-containing protein [Fibrobacter sp. UBA2449]|uniref:fibrobacter succinogenes major paralogous domain-containing protein n=1 Tax=Fibrobacter sp. UBA2449 TaxID=1946529 RepID=UPI0025BCAF35|nr:fibrobacter succinogenes major paralogous domain-containing protein [Fibrobacter sp. UBA2449]